SHGPVRLADPALSLKAILKERVLQEKSGVSFAVEAGPLLPSTNKAENKFGFEGIGIVSGKLASMTYHVNFGGGVDRAETNPCGVLNKALCWGNKAKNVDSNSMQDSYRTPPAGFIHLPTC